MVTLFDFKKLAPAKTAGTDLIVVMKSLMARYLEPHRRYHSLGHIGYGLAEYNKFYDSIDPVTFYAWMYHDSVYVPGNSDNEQRSAMVFQDDNKVIGLDEQDADKVVELIMTTTHMTGDTNLVTDIDLSGLGALPEIYDENTRLIREEYAFASDEMWKAGRTKFIETFLARPQLYKTTQFAAAYTQQARENMSRELSRLS